MARYANSRTAFVCVVLMICLGVSANAYAAADNTTTTVTAPTNNQHVAFGAGFTFTASVHDTQVGPNPDPGGRFYFYADATAISNTTCAATGGTALVAGSVTAVNVDATHDSGTLVVADVSAVISTGSHHITACFLSNDTTNSGWKTSFSNLTAVTLVVDPAPTTTTTISTSATSPILGAPVAFTATVTPSGGSAGMHLNGIVQFKEHSSGAYLGVASLVDADNAATTATFTTSALSLGAHSVDAYYLGNANFAASDTNLGTQAVVTGGVVSRNTRSFISSLTPASVGLTVTSLVNASVSDTGSGAAAIGGAGGFAATGSMVTARLRHAAALLPTGQVLVVGGSNGGGVITNGGGASVAEIYTPGSGFANLTPSSGSFQPRTGGTATLLQDGTVLLTGGFGTAAFATSEIYDPVANSVAAVTSDLVTPRMNHTATMLADGRVLIVGGDNGTTAIASPNEVEVFSYSARDAVSGTFAQVTGDLAHARTGHTATLLTVGANAGSVLITGGDGGGDAELYAVSGTTGTSSAAGSLVAVRSFHRAVRSADGIIAILGGIVGGNAVNTIEFYDPVSNAFTAAALAVTLDTARQGATTTVLTDGTALVTSGSGTAVASGATASSAIYTMAYDPQGQALVASSDTNDTVSQGSTPPCATLVLTGTGTTVCVGSVTPTATSTPGPHTVTVTYTDNHTTGPVHLNNSNVDDTATLTVTSLTVTAAQDTKVYDGTTNPSSAAVVPVLTGTLSGGDVFCGTQSFQSKDVALGTAVTVPSQTNVIMTACGGGGTDHTGNYTISYVNNTTSTISAKALTMSGLSVPASKIYDGTTTAVVSGTPTLQAAEAAGAGTTSDGIPYNVDAVTITGTPVGTYNTKNVATATTVVFSGMSLAGTGSGNYTLTFQASQLASITVKTLVATGLTTVIKIYDATTTGTLTGTATLLPAESTSTGTTSDNTPYLNDVVSVAGTPAGTFSSKDVGSGIGVTVSGLALTGSDSTNYVLAANQQAGLTGNITPKTLAVTGLSATGRAYDSTTTVALTGTGALLAAEAVNSGSTSDGAPYSGDTVSLTGTPVGTFASPHVGTQAVTVTGLSLTGAQAGDYALAVNQQSGLSAVIATFQLIPTLNALPKTYDRTTAEPNGNMSCTLAGVFAGDTVMCTPSAGSFAGATVVGSPWAVTATVTIGGASLSDYTLGLSGTSTTSAPANSSASITTAALTPTLTAQNKPYDQTNVEPNANMSCTVSAVISGDTVTCTPSNGTFASANMGSQNVTATTTIGGADASNYTLGAAGTSVTSTPATATASITTLAITTTLTATNKAYDRTTTEPNANMSCSLTGILPADVANVTCTPTLGNFATANVGSQVVTATVTISGTAAGNYTFGAAGTNVLSTQATATASITSLQVTPTLTAVNKTYDQTNVEPNANMSCSLAGVLTGDAVTCTPSAGTLAGSTVVGSPYTVTATVTIGGAAGGNYTFGAPGTNTPSTTATTSASIITRPITATLAPGNKVFDSTNVEPNTNMTCGFTGVLSGDVVVCTPSAGTFATAAVGTQTVNATATMSGAQATNYTLGAAGTTVVSTPVSATASITVRSLTLTASSALTKIQGTLFTFAGTEFTAVGLQGGDTLTKVTMTAINASSIDGTLIGAPPGSYPVTITPLATGNYTGTLTLSNYTITYVAGNLAVGQAPSLVTMVSAFAVAANASGGTYTFTATVTPSTSGVPTGTVTFTDNGTAIGSPVVLTISGGISTAKVANVTLAAGSSPHAIVATYSGDSNFKTSTLTVYATVTAAPAGIVAGSATNNTPQVSVTYAGALVGGTGQLQTSNLACDIQSAATVVVPALISCTAALNNTLAPGASGSVTITIKTTAGTVAMTVPNERPGSMRALYALSFGMPAVVFIGLAGPLGAIRRKRTFRGKLVTWLGLVLLCALLSMSIGCGGGFSNPNNLGPVTIQRTVPGSYTAVVTYTDASSNKQVLATLPFTVN